MSTERPPDFVIDYNRIRIPIDELNATILNQLDPDRPNNSAATRLEGFFLGLPAILRLTTRIAGKTWDAIRYLCRDRPVDDARQPEFAICVPPMARTTLDSVFNVVFIFDNPATNARWYYAGGWLNALEEYERLKERHGTDPRWTEELTQYLQWVGWMENDARISPVEKADRTLVKYWPHPGRMLRPDTKFNAPDRRAFLEYLNDWFYGHLSQESHGSLLGLARGGFLAEAHERPPGYDEMMPIYRSQVFLRALTLHLALLSEIIVGAQLGSGARRLIDVWEYIRGWPEAADLIDIRYEALLKTVAT